MAARCVPVVYDNRGPREIVLEDVRFRWRGVSDSAVAKAKAYSPKVFESRMSQVLDEYAG